MISLIDVALVVLVYVIVLLIIAISEYARKKFNLRATSTRHAIHLLAGDNMLLLPFFSAVYYPLTIPIGLALLTVYSFRRSRSDIMARTMIDDEYDRFHAYGPLYYIISIAILLITLWDLRHIAMAAVMIMAWGDGAASLLGMRFRRRHVYPHSSKSVEGSLAMLLFSILGALLAMTISLQTSILATSAINIVVLSLAGAFVGTVVEACTIGPLRPFDNFTVPLSAAAAMYLFSLLIL
jgi:phytol kinase